MIVRIYSYYISCKNILNYQYDLHLILVNGLESMEYQYYVIHAVENFFEVLYGLPAYPYTII